MIPSIGTDPARLLGVTDANLKIAMSFYHHLAEKQNAKPSISPRLR
jgi:hypothetical protein